jgi:hypothetical protein
MHSQISLSSVLGSSYSFQWCLYFIEVQLYRDDCTKNMLQPAAFVCMCVLSVGAWASYLSSVFILLELQFSISFVMLLRWFNSMPFCAGNWFYSNYILLLCGVWVGWITDARKRVDMLRRTGGWTWACVCRLAAMIAWEA